MPTVMKNTKSVIVYGDQGISTKTFDQETYQDLLRSDSDEEPIVKYDVAPMRKGQCVTGEKAKGTEQKHTQ